MTEPRMPNHQSSSPARWACASRPWRAPLARLVLVLLALAAAPTAVRAQDDVEHSKDHPMFSRVPNYYIADYDEQEFSTFDLPLDPERRVEGKYWRIEYTLKDDARKMGPVQIARNYANPLVQRGGKTLLDDVTAGGGTAVVQFPVAGKNLWLTVRVSNGGETYELTIVEEAAMEQKVEFTAAELKQMLDERGSVALHDILFDTGTARLRPDTTAALAAVGDLLKAAPGLRIEIQGHTDNVGQPAANLQLSKDRAAAVKAHLVQTFGIAAARIDTTGFGDTKPVADNTSDQGRALNRRVELVKR